MRRGHPGIGGWRGDNPRHFRPRSGGAPHYRPPRSYGLLDQPRYPLSGPRMNRGPHPHPFNTHDGRGLQEHHDRNYRGRLNNNQRLYDRGHDQDQHDTRHIFPLLQRMRHNDVPEHPGSYKDSPHYYEDTKQPDRCHINSLGDVDHRQSVPLRDFDQRKISPWANPPPLGENKRHYYDNRNHPADPYRHNSGEVNTIPIVDTGHRPPSSDHYGSTSRPAVDNNNTSFSRSIDDTVDIVRKRLMNRNDSRRLSIDQTIDPNYSQEEVRESMSTSYLNVNQEQPTKKKIQRQRQFVKSNCDKIKTKIVHQLFKMDKDRIHKLMDNPSSSTKFEYAISSLITESQNSLNRHMRSVAEKSLCNSSEDFIHDDNNTIYEDTFMKQMQCILEPQDTVLLEDIKPLVMAELSKVLQLDDFEHRFDTNIDQGMYPHPGDEHPNYDHYANEFNFDEFTTDTFIDNSKTVLTGDEVDTNYNLNQETNYDQSIPLYERRPTRHSNEYSERIDRRMSSENQHKARRSLDNKPAKIEEPLPLFNAHEQFSDDDDPFAELDKQYHVAVDHNFIETDDPTNQQSIPSSCSSSPNIKSNLYTNVETPYNDTYEIKEEIENEIQNIARSPIKIFSAVNNNIEMEQKPLVNLQLKQEFTPADLAKENEIRATNIASHIVHNVLESSIKQENITKAQEQVKESENSEISVNNSKSSAVSTPRKRSIDQKPSHRKEKRKKSESSQSDASFEISNKTTITDSSKPLDKSHESSNSVFNLFFSSDVKDHKKEESSEKSYSDKYVKRKDPNKKEKEKEKESKHKKIESKEKHNQCSSGHSILSPKDNNQSSNSSQTPTKIDKDTKKKLKPIDMFNDQPKKPNSIHHARRNTATITATKNAEENKPKKPSQVPNKTTKISVTPQVLKKLQSKETQTCLSKSSSSRFCQTDKKKLYVKCVQTDPVTFAKPKFNSKDAFERMKEIDLEIQVLLQEKFKLYSSLESKDSNKSSMETLGMAVLNVETTKEDEDNEPEHALSEDTIVDDFTNIPVEELEQIAFESVQDESNEDLIVDRRSRRTKVLEQERKSSASPNTKKLNKKSNAPNISLIEQIIIDDRPLEDIISLDALENVGKQSPKNRKRPSKSKSRKNKLNNLKKKKITKKNETNPYDLKECVVLLIRKDMSRYIRQDSECGVKSEVECIPNLEPPSCIPHSPKVELEIEEPVKEEEIFEHEEIVEETVENDLQFDMLDVSEDIVIGDNCEVKSIADKVNERVDVPISEEIILDNSQSSIEDMVPSESVQVGNECRMFDYSTDENLRRDSVTVVGNADAVLAIECIENDFIAACLDGNVYHFGSDGQLLNTLRGSNLAVTCLTIVKEKYGTTVYTGSLDSRIRYYDLETGLEKGPECNVLSPIQTMDRAWDTVFVGTRTGFVLQFECKNNMLIPVSTVKFSEQSILALRAMKEGPRKVLLVAARSENVTIKDAQTGLLLRTLCGPKMTVYTLLFEDGKVYCGTSSHHIHVFDYSSGGHVGSHSGGKGAVCLRALGGLVFAGCYDGCVYVYREGEARPIAQLRGPSLMLLSLAVVGTKIIAGYKDRSLYIWKIPLSILQEMIL